MSIVRMGVDHRVDRGTCLPYVLKLGDVMCFVPPYFLGEQMFFVLNLLTNNCFNTPV